MIKDLGSSPFPQPSLNAGYLSIGLSPHEHKLAATAPGITSSHDI